MVNIQEVVEIIDALPHTRGEERADSLLIVATDDIPGIEFGRTDFDILDSQELSYVVQRAFWSDRKAQTGICPRSAKFDKPPLVLAVRRGLPNPHWNALKIKPDRWAAEDAGVIEDTMKTTSQLFEAIPRLDVIAVRDGADQDGNSRRDEDKNHNSSVVHLRTYSTYPNRAGEGGAVQQMDACVDIVGRASKPAICGTMLPARRL